MHLRGLYRSENSALHSGPYFISIEVYQSLSRFLKLKIVF